MTTESSSIILSDEDKKLAFKIFNQLETRITTQELLFVHGVEKTALDSLVDFFRLTRQYLVDADPKAAVAASFARQMLNESIRPFTARWHPKVEDGKLRSDDVRTEFRSQLGALQRQLRRYSRLFNAIATSSDAVPYMAAFRDELQRMSTSLDLDENSTPIERSIPFNKILSFRADSSSDSNRILELEQVEIRRIRGARGQPDCDSPCGLAISGGGLRSATFALGALQALAANRLLTNFDFLSTVSGGGYIGSFLTSFLNSSNQDQVGLDAGDQPFKRSEHSESPALQHLRGHSKFLIAGGYWKRMQIPVLAIYGWVCSFCIVLPPLAFVSIALFLLSRCLVGSNAFGKAMAAQWPYDVAQSSRAGVLLLVFLVAIALLAAVRKRWRDDQWYLRYLSAGLIALVVCLSALLLPGLVAVIQYLTRQSFGGTAGMLLTITAIMPWLKELRNRATPGTIWCVWVTSVLIAAPAMLILGGAVFATQCFLGPSNIAIRFSALLVVFSLAMWWLVDLNDFSLHPFYRSRLEQAYILQQNSAGLIDAGRSIKLSETRLKNPQAPYHIINAALNVGSSTNLALRGRVADFFEFTANFCGAESTGHFPTQDFQQANPKLDLATAMAISGGAAAPYMGVTGRNMTFLFSILNIRLDYWLRIPNRPMGPLDWHPIVFLRQMFGLTDESLPLVNLSDGGHIENLAVYQLLKRRCKYIVVIDGEHDPSIACSSLLQLIRYAYIDFGIKIDIDLDRLKPSSQDQFSTEDTDQMETGVPFVRSHYTMGTIIYPSDDGKQYVGYILYLKSSLTGNEANTITHYKTTNPSFPHQSTADLFYNEEQFECYRALGEHIVLDAVQLARHITEPTDLSSLFKSITKLLNDV